MSQSGNLLADVRFDPALETFMNVLQKPGIRIERIVSSGQVTPPDRWYDQDWTEWVLIIQGSAKLLFEGESAPRELNTGDWLEIGPGVRHKVVYTDPAAPTIWLAVHIGEKPQGEKPPASE